MINSGSLHADGGELIENGHSEDLPQAYHVVLVRKHGESPTSVACRSKTL